jgi:hypothetical protein
MVLRNILNSLLGLALLASLAGGPVAAGEYEDRAEDLRREVMHRFMTQVRENTGMDDQQFVHFEAMTRRSFERRGELQRQERNLWQELQAQMRPGVAADSARVDVILDELIGLGEQKLENARSDMAEYQEFLSPIQRAQVVMSWKWLESNIERIREERGTPRRRRQGG